jgi:predicted amidohydrolase YtcJ
VDVSRARSVSDIQRLLRQRAQTTPRGAWLRAYGYDEFFLAEKRPFTRGDLDAVAADQPIIVRHRTGHAAVLNSVALRSAGVDRHFVPPAGGHIERDGQTGEPTGVVYEMESFLRTVLPRLAERDLVAGVKQVNDELLRQGVTSFHDASAGNSLAELALFRRLHAEGMLTPRATVMIGIAALPELLGAGLTPFVGDGQVRLGSVKILVHESHGALHPEPDELAEMVWQAHRHGFQVAIHAVEEGPICIALEAIARAQQRLPRADHRHRIEHGALCPPAFIEVLRDTGSVVVTQPGFLHWYGEKYLAEVDPEVRAWLYRAKSLLESGVPVAGSSDCPIASVAPLVGVSAAMTRRSQRGAVLNVEERCSLTEALSLFTAAGAWVGFEEADKGRIAPGMFADLVLVDGDLTQIAPEEIAGINVHTTIVGGEIVWTQAQRLP